MFVNSVATETSEYNDAPYIEKIDVNYSSDATFSNFIDVFNALGFTIKKQTVKEEVLSMFGDLVYFSEEENNNLMEKIRQNSVEKKINFFDYYD